MRVPSTASVFLLLNSRVRVRASRSLDSRHLNHTVLRPRILSSSPFSTMTSNTDNSDSANNLDGDSFSQLVKQIIDFPLGEKIVDFVQPEVLEKELENKLNSPRNLQALTSTTDFVLGKCLNTSNRFFLNQLYGGVHPTGLAASYIIEKMNTNQHTYEVAPVFVLTERIILRKLRQTFFGDENGDGIFAPGGSIANMYAMTLARHREFPQVKNEGLFNVPPLVVFTSQDAHYSVSKAANWMGLGLNNVVKVKTTKGGAMITSELEKAIAECRAQNKYPLVVCVTAGSTVLGAFDPFNEIADVCKREKIWMHCDAAWGGGFIFSDKLRQKWLAGIEKCDSVAWNAHKMLGAPLQCSAFITKESEILSKCNSLTASYLFQQDKFYSPEYDACGDKSIQCGRKADAFKLWYMWAYLGVDGFRSYIESAEDCAYYIAEKLKTLDDFIMYLDGHQCTNVFFWYIPTRLRDQPRDEAWWADIGKVTTKIKERMVFDGKLMIGYAPLPHKGQTNAIRLVIPAYPKKTHQDMDFIIDFIRRVGHDL